MSQTVYKTRLDEMLEEKRRKEWQFASGVMTYPEESRHQCGWLVPENMSDVKIKDFWSAVLTGEDATKAAIDAGVLFDLINISGNVIYTADSLKSLADGIAQDAWRVNVAMQCAEVLTSVFKGETQEAQAAIESIQEAKIADNTVIPNAADVGLEFMSMLGVQGSVIKTGIGALDAAIGGLDRGAITLLPARPSMGKTALSLQIARNVAAQGFRTCIFTPEMKSRQLWARMACGLTGVNWQEVKGGEITEAQYNDLNDATSFLMNAYGENLYIDDNSNITTADIWRKCARYKFDLIVIDHIGLISDDDQRWNQAERMGTISWRIKQIAKDHDCVALVPAQLNRKVETRDDKHPMLSDLRDSGKLEENADIVLSLYRGDYYEGEKNDPSEVHIDILKYRDGARNDRVRLDYHLSRQWFTRLGYEYDQVNWRAK